MEIPMDTTSGLDNWQDAYQASQDSKKEDFAEKRKELREKLLAAKLMGETEDTEFTVTFDGCGDSGQCNNDSGNDEVDKLLSEAVERFVTFDWYNNDGGGGDITWDIVADEIIINGYYNETVRTDAMIEEVF
jgi:hypothetical protein